MPSQTAAKYPSSKSSSFSLCPQQQIPRQEAQPLRVQPTIAVLSTLSNTFWPVSTRRKFLSVMCTINISSAIGCSNVP